jgi:hypothetical protein
MATMARHLPAESGRTMMTETVSDTQQYEQLLQQVLEQIQSPSEGGLSQSLLWLDDAARFSGDKSEEVFGLREKVQRELETLRARGLYEETKATCQALWGQEQDLLKAKVNPDRILKDVFEVALKRAEDAYNQYQFFLLLEGLKNDAQVQLNRARERYQIKTTASLLHNYSEQLHKLEEEPDKDREIAWTDERGQFIGSIKVRNAIDSLSKDAQMFAHNKSQEYMEMAEDYVRDHQPRLAHEVLEKRKDLYLLPSEDENRLNKFDQFVIQPELNKQAEAEVLARQAQVNQDLRDGWKLLRQAISTYAWAPGIEDVRKILLSRTLHNIRTYLGDSQKQYQDFCQQSRTKESLQKAEAFLEEAQAQRQQAEIAYQAINELIKNLRAEADEVVQRMQSLEIKDRSHPLLNLFKDRKSELDKKNAAFSEEQLKNAEQLQELRTMEGALGEKVKSASAYQKSIDTEYERLRTLFEHNPEKAGRVLETFLQTYDGETYRTAYGELNAHLPGLQTLRTQILAFENFEQVLQTLEDTFLSNSLTQIEQALKDIETLASREKDSARRKRLNAMTKHMNGRLDFLQGRQAWQSGDFASAEAALYRVIALPNHPDKSEAQKILDGIKDQRTQEGQIQERLQEAQKLLAKQPKRAYAILADILPKPSRFRDEIRKKMEDARRKWESDLLTRLDEASQSRSAMADELRKIAEELLALPEPRALTTTQKARQAKALAFASDARLHEKANRLKEALTAWDQARQMDISRPEFEENWRRVRLSFSQRALNANPGENETQGILQELQNELPDELQVLILIAEQYYRLSRLSKLSAEQRLEYLERAGRETKSGLARTELSPAERGLLDDLRQKIENDNTTLRQQADLERELEDEFSLARLAELLQMLDDLRSGLSTDMPMRNRFDKWWKRLRDEVVSRLENEDEAVENELEKRFEVRSKIALLLPEHRLSSAVGPEIVRQAEKVLRDIDNVLNDYKGIQLKTSKSERRHPLDLVYDQQNQLDELRKRADMLYGLIDRFSARAGGDATRLKSNLLEQRNELTGWVDKFSKFSGQIRNLSYETDLARQSSNWIQFQDVLNEINNSGFGEHRAVRLVLQEKDEIQNKRNRLNQLQSELLDALKDPDGKEIFEALEKLTQLVDEDKDDTFGFQDELSFEIPFQRGVSINKVSGIQRWLEDHARQISGFGNWLYSSGVKSIWPDKLVKRLSEPALERVPWAETRSRLQQMQDKGQFKEVLLLLDVIASGGQAPYPSSKHLETLVKTYARYLPLEKAKQKLSQPPFDIETLLPFLRLLLTQVEDFKKEIQKESDALEEMRSQTLQKQEEWSKAQVELEQSLEELRALEQSVLRHVRFFGHNKQLVRARQRFQEARLRCQAIAPNHPLLKNLD